MDRWREGWFNGLVTGWMDGWVDGWVGGGWTDRLLGGWMDGQLTFLLGIYTDRHGLACEGRDPPLRLFFLILAGKVSTLLGTSTWELEDHGSP